MMQIYFPGIRVASEKEVFLILKALITTAADDFFFFFFSQVKKSYEMSSLISLKN